jgi:hypothetical protein
MTGPQLPPRVKITCRVCGRITRTRQPEGNRLPVPRASCTPCSQDAGRTTMLTVPAGPGNAPQHLPPRTARHARRAVPGPRCGSARLVAGSAPPTSDPGLDGGDGDDEGDQRAGPPRACEPVGWQGRSALPGDR